MTKKRVIILGATGSIGTSALDVLRAHPDEFEPVLLTAHADSTNLGHLSSEFPRAKTVLASRDGTENLLREIRETEADIAVNGISGSSGLMPSIAAIESGKDLALANKETIVMAGPLVRALARKQGRRILPVDSEHSAVFSLLEAYGPSHVSEIILTASGGPFRTWDSERIKSATPKDALLHPTWSMGSKITIDSASLANKGLEVIEAVRLFDVDPSRVKVVVHPESLVHSLIRCVDGVLYAQISPPDMRHPIHAALFWPSTRPCPLTPLTFDTALSMHFEPPRREDFPMLSLAYRACSLGNLYPACYNAANEVAVAAFLEGSLGFMGIAECAASVLDHDWSGEADSLDSILDADRRARDIARSFIKECKR
jgi:1-deoxy-D-xylulose-5-phosphate reductoisomerase